MDLELIRNKELFLDAIIEIDDIAEFVSMILLSIDGLPMVEKFDIVYVHQMAFIGFYDFASDYIRKLSRRILSFCSDLPIDVEYSLKKLAHEFSGSENLPTNEDIKIAYKVLKEYFSDNVTINSNSTVIVNNNFEEMAVLDFMAIIHATVFTWKASELYLDEFNCILSKKKAGFSENIFNWISRFMKDLDSENKRDLLWRITNNILCAVSNK